MAKTIYNNVLIKIDEGDEFDRGTGVKGYDGNEITLVPEWKPTHHRKISGRVIDVPVHIEGQNRGIKMKVKKGDLVYFHYNTLTEARELPGKIYMLEYYRIFCRIDNGIDMVGGYVLVQPVDKDVKDIDVNGLPVKGTETKGGLVLLANKKNFNTGILRHIAEPNEGEPELDVHPGDKVIYEGTDTEFENVIEGQMYYVMHQDDLLACMEKRTKESD